MVGFAVRIFKAAGFVVVLNVLSDEACADVLETCKAWEENMLRCDPDLLGNRDPGRYSMGAASQSRALLHEPAWRNLLDNGAVLDLLECIFLEQGFHFSGGGVTSLLVGRRISKHCTATLECIEFPMSYGILLCHRRWRLTLQCNG